MNGVSNTKTASYINKASKVYSTIKKNKKKKPRHVSTFPQYPENCYPICRRYEGYSPDSPASLRPSSDSPSVTSQDACVTLLHWPSRGAQTMSTFRPTTTTTTTIRTLSTTTTTTTSTVMSRSTSRAKASNLAHRLGMTTT